MCINRRGKAISEVGGLEPCRGLPGHIWSPAQPQDLLPATETQGVDQGIEKESSVSVAAGRASEGAGGMRAHHGSGVQMHTIVVS